jgi:ubiquitin carboxyl-terminal hydrolase 4/11/15
MPGKTYYPAFFSDSSLTAPCHSKSCLIFNKRRPKFMQPGAFIDGQFQNMFELCYFSTNEFVPAGWQAVDEDKSFPRISSRNPQLHQVDEPEDDHDMTNGRAASESSNEDDRFHPETFSSTTRMNEESSDEDELAAAPVSRVCPATAF